MRRVFDAMMTTLALPRHTPHHFRDTFASTHLTQHWGKLGWVSRQLGHESTRTTEEHYYAFQPTADTERYADQIATGRCPEVLGTGDRQLVATEEGRDCKWLM